MGINKNEELEKEIPKFTVPSGIKNISKGIVVLILVVFITGIIFNRPEMYFAFTVGGLFSLIYIFFLIKDTYNIVYVKKNMNYRNLSGFFKRMGIVVIGLLIVGYVSRKYYSNIVLNNIAFAGLGLMSFKIMLYLTSKLKIFAKRR